MKEFIPKNHKRLVNSSFTDFSEYKTEIVKLHHILRKIIRRNFASFAFFVSPYLLALRFPEIVSVQRKARSNGGLSGRYQWVRLYEIQWIMRKFNINSVIEFGSGASTAMFARILKDNSKLFSIEESEFWLKRTKGSLSHQFNGYITFLRRDRLIATKDKESTTRYDLESKIYSNYFDLCYVDGPTAKPLIDDTADLNILDPRKKMPNIDVELFWENHIYPRILVIDGRGATIRRLIQKGKEFYDVYLASFYEPPNSHSFYFMYHTLFVRKN